MGAFSYLLVYSLYWDLQTGTRSCLIPRWVCATIYSLERRTPGFWETFFAQKTQNLRLHISTRLTFKKIRELFSSVTMTKMCPATHWEGLFIFFLSFHFLGLPSGYVAHWICEACNHIRTFLTTSKIQGRGSECHSYWFPAFKRRRRSTYKWQFDFPCFLDFPDKHVELSPWLCHQ